MVLLKHSLRLCINFFPRTIDTNWAFLWLHQTGLVGQRQRLQHDFQLKCLGVQHVILRRHFECFVHFHWLNAWVHSQMPGVMSAWRLHILFTANQTVTVSYTNESFSIPTNYSYHCNIEQMLNATNGKLLISKVQFEAFKNDNKQTFSRTKVNDIRRSSVLQWFMFNFRIASHTSMETSFRSLSAFPSSPWLSWCWSLTSSADDDNKRADTWACKMWSWSSKSSLSLARVWFTFDHKILRKFYAVIYHSKVGLQAVNLSVFPKAIDFAVPIWWPIVLVFFPDLFL